VKHLGLSRAHGEVSSFGSLRLAFWRGGDDGGYGNIGSGSRDHRDGDYDGDCQDGNYNFDGIEQGNNEKFATCSDVDQRSTSYASKMSSTAKNTAPSSKSPLTSSGAVSPLLQATSATRAQNHGNFMPSMPIMPSNQQQQQGNNNNLHTTTPLFDQGCIRTFSPARSPFFPQQQQKNQQSNDEQQSIPNNSGLSNNDYPDAKPSSISKSIHKDHNKSSSNPQSSSKSSFGPNSPHHYAREQFKSSTIHNDSNPIWGTDTHFDSTHHSNASNENNQHSTTSSSSFHIPLQKNDLLPTTHIDGTSVHLEIRLDEEMTSTESLLVGGALSTAMTAATAATSVVGMGRQTKNVGNMGMELLGLGSDRLIGRGYVDLMPLLLGLWEDSWEEVQDEKENYGSREGSNGVGKDDLGGAKNDGVLNEYGKINASAHEMKRRVERMGMLDVWVPLYHPTANNKEDGVEPSGTIHLLISYEPNGMTPKRDDVVAFESFARRPLHNSSSTSNNSNIIGPSITNNILPIIPPLSPLLVIETRNQYLLLQYTTSTTVTSVDRTGNVKSSKWERSHRTRIHRNAIFVIERRTLMDTATNICRLPGDIVLSTSMGQEIAEVSAPIVAGAMELVGPALLWGKFMMSAGGTSVKVGLAGARAATVAVVSASQENASKRRGGGGSGTGGGYREEYEDAGVYSYGG